MSKHDEGRRAFLVALGAGAAATTALVPDALAKSHHQHHAAADAPATDHAAHGMQPMGARHGAFFNDDDSRTIAAFAERLMPGAPGKPGASDADVLNYIDLALAGPYADDQYFYRQGVAQLDAHCSQTYGKPFRSLTAEQQDETIAALEQGKAPAFVWPTAQAFFNVVHKHIRSTAATRTLPAGAWSASPARSRNSRPRTCRAGKRSRASPSSACRRGPRA
jgi:gluconate 2-dehydrogenase gamma chain